MKSHPPPPPLSDYICASGYSDLAYVKDDTWHRDFVKVIRGLERHEGDEMMTEYYFEHSIQLWLSIIEINCYYQRSSQQCGFIFRKQPTFGEIRFNWIQERKKHERKAKAGCKSQRYPSVSVESPAGIHNNKIPCMLQKSLSNRRNVKKIK